MSINTSKAHRIKTLHTRRAAGKKLETRALRISIMFECLLFLFYQCFHTNLCRVRNQSGRAGCRPGYQLRIMRGAHEETIRHSSSSHTSKSTNPPLASAVCLHPLEGGPPCPSSLTTLLLYVQRHSSKGQKR